MASDNVAMLRALGADPLFIKATRVDAIAGLVELMDLAAGAVAGAARAAPGAGRRARRGRAARRARRDARPPAARSTCTEVVYPDGWHLLLRDLQRQVVWDDILAWIDRRAAALGPRQALRRRRSRRSLQRRRDLQRGLERAPAVLARDRDRPLAADRRDERLDLEHQRDRWRRAGAARAPIPGTPGDAAGSLRAIVASPAGKSIDDVGVALEQAHAAARS